MVDSNCQIPHQRNESGDGFSQIAFASMGHTLSFG